MLTSTAKATILGAEVLMRFPLVLVSGAAIGAVVSIVLGATWLAAAIGALVGAVFAYVAYDAPAMLREVPGAARKAVVGIPQAYRVLRGYQSDHSVINWRWWATRGWLWFMALEAAVLATIFVDVAPSYLERAQHAFVAVLSLHLVAGIMTLGGYVILCATENKEYKPFGYRLAQAMQHRFGITVNWDQFANEAMPCTWNTVRQNTMGYLCMVLIITLLPLQGALWLFKEIAQAIAEKIMWFIKLCRLLILLVIAVLVAILMFGWNLFVKVHSEMRLMAFVDTASGVLAGYGMLWVHHGGNLAAAPASAKLTFIVLSAALALFAGMVNYHLVARRWLRLIPT